MLRGILSLFRNRRITRVFAEDTTQETMPRPAFTPQDLVHTAQLPRSVFCPITNMPMSDPVMTIDGFSYEREAIAKWFSMNKKTSPSTGKELPTQQVTPNHTLRATIVELVSVSNEETVVDHQS